MGIKIVLFFSYAPWSFFKYIRKTVSRLSRSYPLLFAIKILMVSQFGDLQEPNMHPNPYFCNFFKYLWPSLGYGTKLLESHLMESTRRKLVFL